MILEQIYLGCLSQASYLIADEASGEAAIVDPRRDIEEYIERAQALGVEIRHVFLTHFHADFVSGHVELRERCGAKIYFGPGARPEYAFESLADGDEVALGEVRIRALHTPGHTPESTCYLVFDGAGEKPHAVLTGDTLFIGDVGRPDLMASIGITAEELAGMMYDSLHDKILPLPDETIVYPGHGAGSACGKNLSTETVCSIGQQRAMNYALQPMPKEQFVAMLTKNQPPAPAYFGYDADLNKRERATLSEVAARSAKALSFEEVKARQSEGAQVLDTRSSEDWCAAHMCGSINIGLGGRFASWCGTILEKDRPIVLITDPGSEQEAITRLGRIGFDQVVGYLEGGFSTDTVPAEEQVSLSRVDVEEFKRELAKGQRPFLLDLRTPGEVEAGAVEDHVHIPMNIFRDHMGKVPKDQELLIYCGSGYRSAIAMGYLLQAGYSAEKLRDLRGGWTAWAEAHVGV